MNEAMVWDGADQLRPVLRPLDELTVHPDNPRRGDIAGIVASLEKSGQQRVLVIDQDGVILAGNHRYLAARELGWTHIAAIPNDLAPGEARAYLLGDNRSSDLGEYDRAELISSIEVIEEADAWYGTGYTEDDLSYLRSLQAAANAPVPDPEPVEPVGPIPPPELQEIVLLFIEEQQHEFAENVRTLRTRYGLDGITDTVLRAIHDEALLANQGEA